MRAVSALMAVSLAAVLAACQPARPTSSASPEAPASGTTAGTEPVFRATGNEPGWLAVVGGPAPGLQVEVDYGQRRFQVPAPTEGADGWVGKAADGTDIKLSFQRTPCQDDMSGQDFDATAMLTVGTRQYHGCGRFAAPAR